MRMLSDPGDSSMRSRSSAPDRVESMTLAAFGKKGSGGKKNPMSRSWSMVQMNVKKTIRVGRKSQAEHNKRRLEPDELEALGQLLNKQSSGLDAAACDLPFSAGEWLRARRTWRQKPPPAALLVQNLHWAEFPADKVVFREGDEGNTFFIIASGSVTITITNVSDPTEQITVATLAAGDTFGDLSLLGDKESSKLRTATVTTTEPCVFLTIDRAPYRAMMKKANDETVKKKVDFLKQVDGFSQTSEKNLRAIANFMHLHTVAPHETIIQAGQTSKYVYLITRGSCRIVAGAGGATSASGNAGSLPSIKAGGGRTQPEGTGGGGGGGGGSGSASSYYSPSGRVIELATLEQGATLGLSSALESSSSGGTQSQAEEAYHVISENKMRLLRISRVDFLKRVDQATQNKLRKICELQSDWWAQRLQDISHSRGLADRAAPTSAPPASAALAAALAAEAAAGASAAGGGGRKGDGGAVASKLGENAILRKRFSASKPSGRGRGMVAVGSIASARAAAVAAAHRPAPPAVPKASKLGPPRTPRHKPHHRHHPQPPGAGSGGAAATASVVERLCPRTTKDGLQDWRRRYLGESYACVCVCPCVRACMRARVCSRSPLLRPSLTRELVGIARAQGEGCSQQRCDSSR